MNKGQLLEQVFAHYENLQKQRKAEYLLRLDEARKNADFRALDDKIRDLEFEIAKKSVYGDAVSSLNSVSSIANSIIDYHFSGNELFSYIDAVSKACFEDIEKRLSEMLDVCNCTLSVVRESETEV